MKRGTSAHLRKYRTLLDSFDVLGSDTEVIWRSANLGSWQSVSPRWWESGGRIRLRFRASRSEVLCWVSSIQRIAGGLKVLLTAPHKPLPEELLILRRGASPQVESHQEDTWRLTQQWLRDQFQDHRILSASRRPDLTHSLSGSFLRVHFRARGREHLVLMAESRVGSESSRGALTQALLYLSSDPRSIQRQSPPEVHLVVPSSQSGILCHRARFVNRERVRVYVWEYDEESGAKKGIRPASLPSDPVEERDFRWPVLGPFRWSTRLARVLELAPHFIRRYPRFQDYDSLRLWGLEFARVSGPNRDRISFGVGNCKTELEEDRFNELRSLVDEMLFYRRPDSPDVQHPFYRAQSERWLEALILEQVGVLFPELVPESVYPQIPVYLGKDPGRVDILGADRYGNLVVMELKVAEDPDLPVQSLDYWGRVVRHNLNGDFERRGYFSGIRLSRGIPRIYLVSPVFSFHDSTERMLRFLDPKLEFWKIAVNEDWRSGVKILSRTRLRPGDPTGTAPGFRAGEEGN